MRYSERIVDSTKPGKYFLLLIFFTLLSAITAFGQTKEEKKMRVQAVKAINSERFSDAISIYKDLLKLSPDNPDYNYEMGLAIYEEGLHRGDAAPYLERAIQNTKEDTLPEIFLFAGKSEQYAGNFDLAVDYFNSYLSFKKREGYAKHELGEDIDRYIEMCQNGKVQFENNKDFIRIENMGANINSEFPDYSPVVTNDENIILFTSRRNTSTGGHMDTDGKYFEDIYYSLNINGTYSPASNVDTSNRVINNQVNTEMHDATITYAGDETQLFIYRDLDVWVSKLDNGLWTIPVKDQGRINSVKGFEPSIFITQDEQTMFVVSDLNSGFGGRDIYITTKDESGQWKSLSNLGKLINTKHDEDAPFLTPDGNTLYFASNGHNSMGDYDIFKSELGENGEWGPAENLGPPINTPGHDRYFVTSDDGAVGYYASDRDGGYGETDIYRIILDCKNVSATMISGIVFSEDLNAPVATTITVFDPKTKLIINSYKSDPKTGKYEMRLKTETTYGFKIEAEGYLPQAGEFEVPKQCDYFTLFQEIKIDNLEDENGNVYAQRAYINNAFFNVDQKVEEKFEGIDIAKLNEIQKDSLRSEIAAEYNPIELTNYIRLIDLIDPNGIRLSSELIGNTPVANIQTRDEIAARYTDRISEADRLFYASHLPEARANYMIASDIRPEEVYPKKQVEIIEEKFKDQPLSAQLSTMTTVDRSKLIVPQLIDSSQAVAAVQPNAPAATPTPENAPEKTPEVKKEDPIKAEPEEIAAVTKDPVKAEPTEVKKVEPIAEKPEEIAAVIKDPVKAQPTEVKKVEPIAEKPEEVAVVTKEPVKTEAPSKADKMNTAKEDETIVFRNILFDFDKADLRKESVSELKKVADYMEKKGDVEVQIDGHADWIGTVEYNMALSEKRAKAAYNHLTKDGVAEERLNYQYFGEAVPIAPNANPDGSDNPEGRQLNRRCEFKIDQSGTADNVVLKF